MSITDSESLPNHSAGSRLWKGDLINMDCMPFNINFSLWQKHQVKEGSPKY